MKLTKPTWYQSPDGLGGILIRYLQRNCHKNHHASRFSTEDQTRGQLGIPRFAAHLAARDKMGEFE